MLWSACPVWLFALVCECLKLAVTGLGVMVLRVLWQPCAAQCLTDTLVWVCKG